MFSIIYLFLLVGLWHHIRNHLNKIVLKFIMYMSSQQLYVYAKSVDVSNFRKYQNDNVVYNVSNPTKFWHENHMDVITYGGWVLSKAYKNLLYQTKIIPKG